jgi:hypothetical protein
LLIASGGYIKDIYFRDLLIVNVTEGILVSMFYSDDRPPTNATATPSFSNINFFNITGTNIKSPGGFVGLPESKISFVNLTRVHMQTAKAWQCTDTTHLVQVDTVPSLKCN